MHKSVKFFLDTEFIENGPKAPIHLLSIGIVSEKGNEFYRENIQVRVPEFYLEEKANDFVKQNVIPNLFDISKLNKAHLESISHRPLDNFESCKARNWRRGNTPLRTLEEIRSEILEFIFTESLTNNEVPEFWGYYSDYDWVLFCQIFGTMMDLPEKFPKYCKDLRQEMDENVILESLDDYLRNKFNHNALEDAKQIKEGWNKLHQNIIIESLMMHAQIHNIS